MARKAEQKMKKKCKNQLEASENWFLMDRGKDNGRRQNKKQIFIFKKRRSPLYEIRYKWICRIYRHHTSFCHSGNIINLNLLNAVCGGICQTLNIENQSRTQMPQVNNSRS